MRIKRPRRLGAGAASFLLLSSAACTSARAPLASKAPEPDPALASGRLELIEAGAGLPRSGQWRHSFALADLDGDGRLDLAHGPARKGARRPVVFLGDGKGGFRRWDEAKYPAFPYDYGGIAAGDVDGDGRTDLALGVHMLGVAVLLQKEPGVFSLSVEGLPVRGQGTGPAFSSRAVALADADGDGRLDLLALSEGPLSPGAAGAPAPLGIALFLGLAGAWQRTAPGPAPDTAFGSGLAAADVNGDGVPDLLVTTGVQGDRRILRLGTREGSPSFLPVELTDLPERAFVLAAGFGDFDSDGRPDLVVSTLVPGKEGLVSRVDVFLSRPPGFESRPVLSEPGRHPRGAVAAGDLNGDGRTDLALLGGDGTLETWLGDGRGGFVPAARVKPPADRAGCAGYHVAVRDLDGDGLGDVVAAFAGEASASDPDAPCLSGGALAAWRSSVPGR